jgi:acyl carrier protein
MSSLADVTTTLRGCIARYAGVDPARIRYDATFAELGIDSARKKESLRDVEHWFGIMLLPQIDQIKTVQDSIDIVMARLGNLSPMIG